MIKINLTPFEELDNPRWWVTEAAIAAAVFCLTFGSVYFYIDSVKQEIATKEAEKQTMISETAALEGDIRKFDALGLDIEKLKSRRDSLRRITESKLVRFMPVILLENIQNLKPDKVWLQSLGFDEPKRDPNAVASTPPPATPPPANGSAPPAEGTPPPAPVAPPPPATDREVAESIVITGSAVDNVAIAEFMVALKATQNQSFDKGDLRTQLFFSDVGIEFSAISTDAGAAEEDKPFVTFKLVIKIKEKLDASQDGKFSKFIDQFNRTGQASIN